MREMPKETDDDYAKGTETAVKKCRDNGLVIDTNATCIKCSKNPHSLTLGDMKTAPKNCPLGEKNRKYLAEMLKGFSRNYDKMFSDMFDVDKLFPNFNNLVLKAPEIDLSYIQNSPRVVAAREASKTNEHLSTLIGVMDEVSENSRIQQQNSNLHSTWLLILTGALTILTVIIVLLGFEVI